MPRGQENIGEVLADKFKLIFRNGNIPWQPRSCRFLVEGLSAYWFEMQTQ